MPPPSALASYKKKSGTIAISADQKSLTWSPIGASPAVDIAVTHVTSKSLDTAVCLRTHGSITKRLQICNKLQNQVQR